MPLLLAWEDVLRVEGEAVILEHVWTTAGRWHRYLATTRDLAGWHVERVGPFVVAHRVLI
jgi:hypothetical protein